MYGKDALCCVHSCLSFMKLLHFFRYKTERTAFTLVEIMIVIAVLGLLFLAVRSFSTDASVNQERSTRLANAVHDILRDARHDTTVGKSHNGESVFRRIVRIVSSGTSGGNMVTVKYLTGNTDISTINFDSLPQESTFSAAFDGDANYSIEKIEVFTGTLSNDFANPKREGFTPITVEALDLHFTSDIAGTAYVTNPQPSVNSSDIKSYLITLDYKGFKRYVYGDVLVGNSHVVIQDGGSTNERIAASEGVHESAQSCPV